MGCDDVHQAELDKLVSRNNKKRDKKKMKRMAELRELIKYLYWAIA